MTIAPSTDPTNPTGWKYRRRATFCTLLYCGAGIGLLGFFGDPSSALHKTIAEFLHIVAMAALANYGITASWERTKGV